MQVTNVFGRRIIRAQCQDESFYRNKELLSGIDRIFNLPEIMSPIKYEQPVGGNRNTLGANDFLQPINLPGSSELIEWITQQFLLAKDILGKKGNRVVFQETSMKKSFAGAYGICHNHTILDDYRTVKMQSTKMHDIDAVGIFYVDVPQNSADLVIVRDGKIDTYLNEYNQEDLYSLPTKQGEIIIHDADTWHSAGTHNNDLPRIVFVFDVKFEE